MPITAFYAALLSLLFLVLSLRTIAVRRAQRVEIGDGGDKALLRRIRVHANFAEYVPMALVLMALAELMRPAAAVMHATGAVLLVGRVAHAYGLSQEPHNMMLRVVGMVATFTAIVAAAITCAAMSVGSGALTNM